MPLLVFFLVLWLFGGAAWYAQQEQQRQSLIATAIPAVPPFSIRDSSFVLRVAENTTFLQSNHNIHIPESVNLALQQLVEHLRQYPHKSLWLTGSYLAGEANHSAYSSLGLARAEALKSRLIRLGLEGHRIHTRERLEAEMNFQEGAVYGAVDLQVKSQ